MSYSSIRSLRIRFTRQVSAEAIDKLHSTNGTGKSPEIVALLAAIGGGHLKPVYSVSPEEVVQDEYGMAREFILTLDSGIAPDESASSLISSGLVDQVRPVQMRSTY